MLDDTLVPDVYTTKRKMPQWRFTITRHETIWSIIKTLTWDVWLFWYVFIRSRIRQLLGYLSEYINVALVQHWATLEKALEHFLNHIMSFPLPFGPARGELQEWVRLGHLRAERKSWLLRLPETGAHLAELPRPHIASTQACVSGSDIWHGIQQYQHCRRFAEPFLRSREADTHQRHISAGTVAATRESVKMPPL